MPQPRTIAASSIRGDRALLLLLAITSPARAAALALVLAVDVSESVSAERYLLQHDGIARAFEIPRLLDAIAAVPGGIEALVLEWSDPDKIAVTVGWTRIADATSAAAFAAAVRATKRSSNGLTAIGSALLAAAAAFDHLPEPAGHRVIDISGDGMANFGVPPIDRARPLVAAGITINGLAILTEEPWLDEYYRSNVIGGPGAFVVVAKDFDSFADAMLRKLVQEVGERAGHPPMRRRSLDAVGAHRRKAVEPDRGVARGVGAGRQDLDLVADLKAERQPVFGLLVQDVGAVAGRAGEDRPAPPARRGPGVIDAVFDALVHRLGEPVELADIEIDPALSPPSPLSEISTTSLWISPASPTSERPGSMMISGRSLPKCRVIAAITAWAYSLDARHLAAIMRRKAAADIDHAQIDVGLGEQPRTSAPRRRPRRPIAPRSVCCEPTWNETP